MLDVNSHVNKTDIAECFLDNFGFGAFRIDTEGKLLYANAKLLNMLGFDFEYQLHEKITESGDFKNNFSLKRFELHDQSNSDTPKEHRWMKNNGNTILFREFIKSVKNKNSQVLFFDCIVEDLTEKYFVENLFQDIKAGNYSIMKAFPDSFFILSRMGQVLDCKNIPISLMTEFSSHIGKSIFDLLTEETANLVMEQIELALEDGELHTIEICVCNAPTKNFFEARVVVCSPEQVMMVLRDITQQKNAELQLRETSEKLKVSNDTKDKFMSIIGHDLRTPINGLLGYSEILSNDLDELSREEIIDYTTSISEIALSANKLLTNLLEWSRIQTGNISFEPRELIFNSSVERVIGLLTANASNKQISLINNTEKATLVTADENMLELILINFIGNAIKFTNDNGKVEITLTEKNNKYEVCVSDNGVGMTNDTLSKIFTSEMQITTLGTRKEKGTGLGLMLCKEFVERHGGNIWVESEVNIGTKFYFTLAMHSENN
jgi:PAS domain S-box-containing protein